MSISSLSSTGVSDARLEEALRNAVERLYKSDPEKLTAKRIRTDVEQDLGLDDGFFKNDASWNTRSKEVIQSQVAAQEAQSQPPSSQPAPRSSPPAKSRQSSKAAKASSGKKRPSTSDQGSKKRQKKDRPTNGRTVKDADNLSEPDLARPVPRQSKSSSPLSELDGPEGNTVAGTGRSWKASDDAIHKESESELSSLIGEDPKPKKGGRKASSEKPKPKKKDSAKATKVPQQASDPDTEEIKRLQGWLVKCGIRKMWFKELAPYDTPKAKIWHLKDLLSEAGMTGRYSQEKATQIREERELKADLADVQAGNQQWGKTESEEDKVGRPRRRLARGLQELDFLKDDDGEETD